MQLRRIPTLFGPVGRYSRVYRGLGYPTLSRRLRLPAKKSFQGLYLNPKPVNTLNTLKPLNPKPLKPKTPQTPKKA